jgi:hypothetical protein
MPDQNEPWYVTVFDDQDQIEYRIVDIHYPPRTLDIPHERPESLAEEAPQSA